jgi:hypothetical protein
MDALFKFAAALFREATRESEESGDEGEGVREACACGSGLDLGS